MAGALGKHSIRRHALTRRQPRPLAEIALPRNHQQPGITRIPKTRVNRTHPHGLFAPNGNLCAMIRGVACNQLVRRTQSMKQPADNPRRPVEPPGLERSIWRKLPHAAIASTLIPLLFYLYVLYYPRARRRQRGENRDIGRHCGHRHCCDTEWLQPNCNG